MLKNQLDSGPGGRCQILADTKRAFSPVTHYKPPLRPARLLLYFSPFVNVDKFAWPCWKPRARHVVTLFLIMSVRRWKNNKRTAEDRHILRETGYGLFRLYFFPFV